MKTLNLAKSDLTVTEYWGPYAPFGLPEKCGENKATLAVIVDRWYFGETLDQVENRHYKKIVEAMTGENLTDAIF